MKYQFPCTGNIEIKDFGLYLEREIKVPRRNINLLSEELRQRFGEAYFTLTNSGSSANLVAALALAEKVKKAGKPMTAVASSFTFPTTMSSLILAGFDVTLLDVDTFNMDFHQLERLDFVPSVIALTHFLGFPADIKRFREYADAHGSLILQDACETIEMYNEHGKPLFQYGDITTWSFYHPHHLSSYGGGAVLTLNRDDYALVDSICHWGRACKCHIDPSLCNVPDGPAHQFTYERLGVNVEISELNACFGRWQLQHWDEIEQRRRENYEILYQRLHNTERIKVWPMPVHCGTPFVFPVQVTQPASITDAYDFLSSRGIEIRTLMGGATESQAAFRYIKVADTTPHARKSGSIAETTFFVGIHHTLPKEQIYVVADAISMMANSIPWDQAVQ